MAIYSSNQSNNWILSVKIALISTGVLSMAVALKLSVPVVADFVTTEVPSLWIIVLSWLKPPYLYVVINFIIISIVASSKLQPKSSSSAAAIAAGDEDHQFPQPRAEKISVAYGGGVGLSDYGYAAAKVTDAEIVYGPARDMEARVLEPAATATAPGLEMETEKMRNEAVAAPEIAGSGADVTAVADNGLQRKESVDFSSFLSESEKPSMSSRFGHRKAIKYSPEGGKSLRVSKPKKQDTLETTWKTITEGRAMPLTRHLKKSDTWETHLRRHGQNDENTPPPAMKKSETFAEYHRSPASGSPGSGKIRKEPSLSQDELNRRVEAFIKKFNEEMRLQRQESLNQYREMISRGAR